MDQFLAITKNTFLQAVRQPVYGIIVIVTLAGIAMAPSMTGWTLDDDNKMLRDIGLSTLLIQGLFLACFAAASVLDSEIEEKTVLTVAAKPVNRSIFVLGKFLGITGALCVAHYLAMIAFFMSMRHGVLETSAQTSDMTVLILGPGLMVIAAVLAAAMNYLFDRRFLPTLVGMAVPFLTVGACILFVFDRDFNLQTYEVSQDVSYLPAAIVPPDSLKGIVEFVPDEGNDRIEGHRGKLVRSTWKGPINDVDRAYLINLVDNVQWRKGIRFLVQTTRDHDELEVFKASILILGAVVLLAGVAVASATRLSAVPTFLVSTLVICGGLASDQVIRPLAEAGKTWADVAYRLIPNFQCFWMVDALNEGRTIPLDYMGSAFVYGLAYTTALLILAMAIFETREVG